MAFVLEVKMDEDTDIAFLLRRVCIIVNKKINASMFIDCVLIITYNNLIPNNF
jgi:hypothetical protein